uniref:Platelet-derived growth factor subunit B n=1 Tax=Periophthalmus magnuspinnatus TaxID=409849 RepID=A0A3B4ABJ3_9GOBI
LSVNCHCVKSLLLVAFQGDPLPAALVELVRNSPISSIEDLQLLLLSDSVDSRAFTLLSVVSDAQPAQQALCKVRTEVVEVTRSMLDQSNAHFLLWPPCVEVQRCSGCCNTKSLQCVPVVTHTRYLQVMKIEYMNKKPTYAKAVVSVLDHVECRCQPATRPPPPKKKSPRRPHGNQAHGNQTLSTAQGQVKVHSKDELHQWDELKQNQRSHMEHDLTDQHWSLRGDTFTRAADSSSLPREHPSRAEEAFHLTPLWSHNSTSDKTGHSAGNITTEVRDNVRDIPSFGLDESTQTHSPTWHQDKYTQIQTSASSSSPASVTPNPDTHTEANGDERRPRPTKEPNPDPQVRHGDNETPQKDRLFEREEAKLEEERKELLLLHKRLDQEKEILRQQQLKREEEERLREAEGHLHKHHRHHVQTTTHTTGKKNTHDAQLIEAYSESQKLHKLICYILISQRQPPQRQPQPHSRRQLQRGPGLQLSRGRGGGGKTANGLARQL